MPVKFSLVLGTVGRVQELERFLSSLARQMPASLELIVVDQNPDDRLDPLLRSYSAVLPVRHVRSPRGLARARNAGLRHASGEIVAFPDDDCWYPPGLLARVQAWFEDHPAHQGLCGRCVDENGRPSQIAGPRRPRELTARAVWTEAISITVFLRREAVEAVGPFDESLGVGSGTPWGSGEESDYMLRVLSAGYRVACEPAIEVGHPAMPAHEGDAALQRALTYGAGMGRVLRKHRAPLWQKGYVLFRAGAGALLGMLRLRPDLARFHWYSLRGRWRGLFEGQAP